MTDCRRSQKKLVVEVVSFQTKCEGEMCDRIHQGFIDNVDEVIINARAWTYYSYGLRDALAILTVPVVEIHMSNIHARKEFRQPMLRHTAHRFCITVHAVAKALAFFKTAVIRNALIGVNDGRNR